VAALGLGPFAACVTPGLQQVQSDLDGIQQQLWKVQKDSAALTEQIGALRTSGAQAGSAPSPTVVGAAELKLRLDGIDHDLSVLKSRADDSDQRLGAIAQELRATREALQSLLRALPAPGGAVPSPSEGAGAAAAGAPAPSGSAAAPGGLAPAGGPTVSSGTTAGGPPPGEDLYRQGYSDFAKGNYALALQELQEFVRRNPKSDLADDAQYLTGEVQYAQQRYPEAIAAYDQLLQAYPSGDKAAAAYLKKGLALLEMNRTAEAVIQLQHVITAYPRSEEARVARERLREMGLKDR